MIKKLHIFTPYGCTYSFQNVYDFVVNEAAITFTFRAMSDGQIKQANFFTKNICGYTKLEEPELAKTYQCDGQSKEAVPLQNSYGRLVTRFA